jgi:hypothetical protein
MAMSVVGQPTHNAPESNPEIRSTKLEILKGAFLMSTKPLAAIHGPIPGEHIAADSPDALLDPFRPENLRLDQT